MALVVGACTTAPEAEGPSTPVPSPGASTPAGRPAATSERLADAAVERLEVAAAVVDGSLYVAGGFVPGGVTAAVEIYDPEADRWSRAPDLPIPVHHAAGVAWRGTFVVLGGFTTGAFSGASDRAFVLRDGAWAELPRMRRARGAGGAAVVGDSIVVVGGQDGARLIQASEVFDGVRWRDVAAIPTPRDHLAVVASGDALYAIGGRRLSIDATLPTLERYDPADDVWRSLAAMPTARGGLGAAAVDGRLVVVGGEGPTPPAGPGGVFDEIEVYDVEDDRWASLSPDLLTARHGIGVAAVEGRVLVAVGGRERGGSYSRILEALTLR